MCLVSSEFMYQLSPRLSAHLRSKSWTKPSMTKQLVCSCPIGWLQLQHWKKKLDEDNPINIIIALWHHTAWGRIVSSLRLCPEYTIALACIWLVTEWGADQFSRAFIFWKIIVESLRLLVIWNIKIFSDHPRHVRKMILLCSPYISCSWDK